MYKVVAFVIALIFLPFLYVAWMLFINNYKLYRIRRAVEQGKRMHLCLRNNYRNTYDSLKELEQTAASRGYAIAIAPSNFDRDYPGLPSSFNVIVHPIIKSVNSSGKDCLDCHRNKIIGEIINKDDAPPSLGLKN